jgi:hypothetical protein
MQNIQRSLIITLCLSTAAFAGYAQPNPTVAKVDSVRNLRKLKVLGFPVVSYSPETRIGYGVAGIALFRFGNDPLHTAPSQVSLGLGYTQNKQQLYYVPFQLYTNRNKFNIYGEAGYYKYSYYYYGIGTNAIPRELYNADYPRIRISVLYKWAPHYYAGLRYNYENYRMTSTTPGGELEKGIVPGSRGSVSSGAGVVQILDKRDTVLYPTKGYWMELVLLFNTTSMGSSNNYQQYSYDVTWYRRVYKKVIWANEVYTKYLNGTAPFDQYAFLGGNKKLRGFYEGRYRDKHSLIIQTEFRSEFYKGLGGAVFGGAGFLGGDNEYVRFNTPYWAYGVGLRYKVNKSDHLNLRLDYAFGNGKGNFYATFGEAF